MFGCSTLAQVAPQVIGLDAVLSNYVFVFYVAFLVTFLMTPLMRKVAIHYWIVDEPDQNRKIHKAPVAYLGGVALFLGWICGMAIAQYLKLHRIQPGWPTQYPIVKFSIVVGAMVIVGQALMVSRTSCESLQPFTSVACTVKSFMPAKVGVPDRTPPGDRLMPTGNCPAVTLQVMGATPPICRKVKGG